MNACRRIEESLRRNSPQWARDSSLSRLHDHRHTTRSRTPLDERSARTQRPLSDNTQHSQEKDIHVPPSPGEIRNCDRSNPADADTLLRGAQNTLKLCTFLTKGSSMLCKTLRKIIDYLSKINRFLFVKEKWFYCVLQIEF